MVDLYTNEKNEVAVLVSYGYGAGWSTWEGKELAYDKRVVEFYLSENKDNLDLLEMKLEEWGYHDVYIGGWSQCKIEWVPRNIQFIITEYAGAEHIEYVGDIPIICF